MIQQKIIKEGYSVELKVFDNEHLELEGRIAQELVQRWGTVSAIQDGEDSAGRAKIRLQEPEELVQRAFKTAELFMKTAREKNLVATGPTLEDYEKAKNEVRGELLKRLDSSK